MTDAACGEACAQPPCSDTSMAAKAKATCLIRRVLPGDLNALLQLCDEHARHEGAAPPLVVDRQALAQALFSLPPRLYAWVADSSQGLAGYVTATAEFSTWQAAEFLHMDCLYLRDGWRGAGIGAAMLNVLADFASLEGFLEIQWQTPDWNMDAARFYRRYGAEEKLKRRFFLRLDQVPLQRGSTLSGGSRKATTLAD